MDYKYSKKAGQLNEIAPAANVQRSRGRSRHQAEDQEEVPQQQVGSLPFGGSMHSNIGPIPQSMRAQLIAPAAPAALEGAVGSRSGRAVPRRSSGVRGMFYFTINEGERFRVVYPDGHIELVDGPKRIWIGKKRIEAMNQYIAHPGEFLIVRFRDGRQEHLQGPASVWFDPKEHHAIEREDALPISAKEAIVVYSNAAEAGKVERRIVHGPATFVPEPGDTVHTFSWHGSRGGDAGFEKVPNGLVFQKLWFLPDQMYHDVHDVRTSDDAVLTIRLMLFFELVDLTRMLDSTHDPIGDFVNATTSDVVDFTGRHDFESFKRHTEKLNDLATYPQLAQRAEQCGYRINKLVYRGYGAPESLQRMHDEAIESRTRLQLERATQKQAQDLEDFKLERELLRASRHRAESEATASHELAARDHRRDSDLADAEKRRAFEREQRVHDLELRTTQRAQELEFERMRLERLRELGVDLTQLLTHNKADRVIEVRGAEGTHVHLGNESND